MKSKDKLSDFYREVFNDGNAQAAREYLAEGYRQHNPGVADGRDGFIQTFDRAFRGGKTMNLKIVKVVEGESYAAVLLGRKGDPLENGSLVDLYRVDEDGLLCEHWDVFGGR